MIVTIKGQRRSNGEWMFYDDAPKVVIRTDDDDYEGDYNEFGMKEETWLAEEIISETREN